MAENKDEQLTDEELAQLQLAEENENAVDRLVKELGCPTRRIRQFAARVLHLLAERDPQRVVPCVPALIEALDRPEAQTRWEALDALTALATTCPEQLGDAFEGAETALFDEISSTLRYAAFRLLCVWGATSVEGHLSNGQAVPHTTETTPTSTNTVMSDVRAKASAMREG